MEETKSKIPTYSIMCKKCGHGNYLKFSSAYDNIIIFCEQHKTITAQIQFRTSCDHYESGLLESQVFFKTGKIEENEKRH